jgi:hypothetical protein
VRHYRILSRSYRTVEDQKSTTYVYFPQASTPRTSNAFNLLYSSSQFPSLPKNLRPHPQKHSPPLSATNIQTQTSTKSKYFPTQGKASKTKPRRTNQPRQENRGSHPQTRNEKVYGIYIFHIFSTHETLCCPNFQTPSHLPISLSLSNTPPCSRTYIPDSRSSSPTVPSRLRRTHVRHANPRDPGFDPRFSTQGFLPSISLPTDISHVKSRYRINISGHHTNL